MKLELRLEKRPQFRHRDGGEAIGGQGFFLVHFVVTAQLGHLGGNLFHHVLGRELAAHVQVEGFHVGQQASCPRVGRGIHGPGGVAEHSRDQVIAGITRPHCIVKVENTGPGADRRHTGHSGQAQDMQVACGHAHFLDRGQDERHTRQSLPATPGRQTVQKRTGGAVIGLGRVAEGGGHRGKHHEVIQRTGKGGAVEMQGAMRLGCEHTGHGFGRHVGQQVIVNHAGQMEHPLERPVQIGNAPPHIVLAGHVAHHDVDPAIVVELRQETRLAHPFDRAPPFGIPVHQREMAGPGRRQVREHMQSNTTQAAGHQVGGLQIQVGLPIGNRHAGFPDRWRRLQDQLALMLSGHHQAQGLTVVPVREHRDGQGSGFLCFEQFQACTGQVLHQTRFFQHQPVNIDRGETQVLAKGGHVQRTVGIDVHLANLAVPAPGPQGLQAQGHVMARQGVQHDIDPFAAGTRHQVVVPVVAVRIKHVPHPHGTQFCPFLLVARSRVNLRPHVLGQGDGGQPHTTQGRVDEHPLALAEAGQVQQRIVRGRVHGQHRRALQQGQGCRFGKHVGLVGNQAVGNASAP